MTFQFNNPDRRRAVHRKNGENMRSQRTLKTEVLLKTNKIKVIAFYQHEKLLWTKTYVYDDEGAVEKYTCVFADGSISVCDEYAGKKIIME